MDKKKVIVAGAGPAGSAAAYAAASTGAEVLLVETSNAPGGAASNCLVNPFMPNGTKVDGKFKPLSAGFYDRVREGLDKMTAKYHPELPLGSSCFHEEYLKTVLIDLLTEVGVKLAFNTVITDAKVENGHIKSVTCSDVSGKHEEEADYFIDATGDASLCTLSGVKTRTGRPTDGLCQPMTLCFRLIDVDKKKVFTKENRILRQEKYSAAKAANKIKNPRNDILMFDTVFDNIVHFNTTRIIMLDPTKGDDISKAELESRAQAYEMLDFLRDNIPGFENAKMLSTAAHIGVRESRMVDTEYVLTEEDLKNCTRFDDSIACGNYDIDIHDPDGGGTSHYYFPEGQYYTIPYRTLVPSNTDNLLVAGRCIGTTHEAQASVRIMPICFCTGEAAGAAAALAGQQGCTCSGVDIALLQARLRELGAVID